MNVVTPPDNSIPADFPPRITIRFNLFLTFVFVLINIAEMLTDDAAGRISHIDNVIPDSLLKIIVLVFLLVAVLWLSSIAVKQFWNRLIATLTTVRHITLAEAYALLLIVAILKP